MDGTGGATGAQTGGGSGGRAAHFRAFARRPVHLGATLSIPRLLGDRAATIIDVGLAGAGVETQELLVPGERIQLTLDAPTRWDPLVLAGVVAWAHPPRATGELDARRRPRITARAGLTFDYPGASAVLAVFEMLAALDYDA